MARGILQGLLALSLLAWGGAPAQGALPRKPAHIELKDGWYYLDGHRTLVNAIGYESGARPGEVPYETRDRNLAQVRTDLERIKAAGFNGIRTWAEMSEAELKVVQASGLKVIFGIWLKPDEDFSDPAVVARDLDLIRKVLAYSRSYDCVITYLIMNEPMPEHLRKVGAKATRDLWTRAVALIHQLHPGVPVTMSGNTAITEWIDFNLFDVYGRNAYDYKEGSNYTHGYATSQRAIADSLGQGKPSLLTEFGRSVSRSGGNYYGGNTLQEQSDALLKYYRDILDSGATGLCPFYFADGWWKGGSPAIHNDEAEEWFGFHGFRNAKDTVGYARPVWHALTRYNRALVTSPKNQQFYQNEVPIEAFCQPEVRRLRVVHLDTVLLELLPDARGYCAGKVSFPGAPLQDRELVVEACDAKGRVLKTESLVILTSKDPILWPSLRLTTPITNLAGVQEVPVQITLEGGSPFTLGEEVRYAFSHHKGWDRAEPRARKIDPRQGTVSVADTYRVPEGCPMLALYAGVDIRYGRFVRTLGAQVYLYPGTWADPLRLP